MKEKVFISGKIINSMEKMSTEYEEKKYKILNEIDLKGGEIYGKKR